MALIMRRHFVVAVAFLLILVSTFTSTPACAEEYAPQTPVGRMMQGLNPANWKMPEFKMPTIQNLMPGQDDKDRIIERKNGLVDEVKGTAMRSWTKTKETLNPMRFLSGGLMGGTSDGQQPVQQTGGFFSNLLSGGSQAVAEPSAVQPASGVNDFLNMTKPSP